METKYFTLSSLTHILRSYSQKSKYSTPTSFYNNVIFTAENQAGIQEGLVTYDSRTKYYLSALANLKFSKHLTQNKLAAEISRLIVLFYKDKLTTIEAGLKQDFSSLPTQQLDQLNNKLNEHISSNSISSITPKNIGKKIVACILLAFYSEKMPGRLQIGSQPVKAAIDILRLNHIDLKKFVSDFSRYKLKCSDESDEIDYSNWDLSYNIDNLIKLYLKNDDNQSKEKHSISSHKKYVASSTEYEKTIYFHDWLFLWEIIDKLKTGKKIYASELAFIYRIGNKYPENPDIKIYQNIALDYVKENNEKNDRQR